MTAQARVKDFFIAQCPQEVPSTWNAPTLSILPLSSSFLQWHLKSRRLARVAILQEGLPLCSYSLLGHATAPMVSFFLREEGYIPNSKQSRLDSFFMPLGFPFVSVS